MKTGYVLLIFSLFFSFAQAQNTSTAVHEPNAINSSDSFLKVTAVEPSSLSFSWESGGHGDLVRYRESGNEEWNILEAGNNHSQKLRFLKPRTHYQIQVHAGDEWSKIYEMKTIGRPNLLVIVCDDGRYDNYTVNGGPAFFQSPNINRIANEGVNFKYCFPSFSLCSPSRANIVTGLMTHHNGIVRNGVSDSLTLPTISQILHDSGYYSIWVGKYGFNKFPQPGFDVYTESSNDDYWDTYYFTNQSNANGSWAVIPGHKTNVLTNVAEYYLNHAPNDKPWVMFLDHKAPHVPLQPRPEDSDLYKLDTMPSPSNFYHYSTNFPSFLYQCHAYTNSIDTVKMEYLKYYQLLAGVEFSVGAIINLLEDDGILDSTLIIYTSDNGLLKGEHLLSGKQLANEESIRLPMFIRYPKWFSDSTIIDEEMAMNIDIAPTLLDAAGFQNPTYMDGISLRDLVNGNKHRKELLFEHSNKDQDCTPTFRSIRDFQYLYTYNYCSDTTEEFFDLVNDSLENTNQINNPAFQSLIQLYRDKLDSLRIEFGDTLPADTIVDCQINFATAVGNEDEEGQGFNIYPNPGNGNFTLEFPTGKSQSTQIVITDILGRKIYERNIPAGKNQQREIFSLENSAAGVYFISLRSGNEKHVVKYVKEE